MWEHLTFLAACLITSLCIYCISDNHIKILLSLCLKKTKVAPWLTEILFHKKTELTMLEINFFGG